VKGACKGAGLRWCNCAACRAEWDEGIRQVSGPLPKGSDYIRWRIRFRSMTKAKWLLREFDAAMLRNPDLPVDIWLAYFDSDSVAAVENPALPLWLLENPGLLSSLPDAGLWALLELDVIPDLVWAGLKQVSLERSEIFLIGFRWYLGPRAYRLRARRWARSMVLVARVREGEALFKLFCDSCAGCVRGVANV
jgi:hypothetical protein